MKKLKIIRASAGSGKTFTLAVEYIKHLVLNPLSYKNILAVTFTNKATLEMKQRVLSQLYGLSRGLEDSKDYMSALKKLLEDAHFDTGGKPMEKVIAERCTTALNEIIHNYHRFRIETIDSFFQSIVRELAHDLDLTANLRVDLDNNAALQEGVAKVIDSIAVDEETKQRVFTFVFSKINENKNWTVSKEMQDFGQNIFNENFLEYGEELRKKLEEKDFINNIRTNLDLLLAKAIKDVKRKAQQLLQKCTANNLDVNDFVQKSKGVYGFIEKLSAIETLKSGNSYVSFSVNAKKCLECADNWSKDGSVVSTVESTGMVDDLKSLEETLNKSTMLTISADAVLKNLNNLSLINIISNMVQLVTSERNDFLLANTNHFLNQMIEGSDVPFIYERTGSRFDHIMIDEFQDTSGLQWKNFKPLIKNSLDSNEDCMLVGDVKQSIYRWRNSEWSILNNISHDRELEPYVDITPLKTNFRSCSNVVTFNNDFFEQASEVLQKDYSDTINAPSDDIRIAYDNCSQEVSGKNQKSKGFVKVELHLPPQKQDDESIKDEDVPVDTFIDDEDTGPVTSMPLSDSELWQCQRLEQNVKDLLSNGVEPKDICILIRVNRHVKMICDYFDHNVCDDNGNPIKIISSQAYELGSSTAVNIIIWALRVLASPSERLPLCMLTFHYQMDVKCNSAFTSDPNSLFLMTSEEQKNYLPEEFVDGLDSLQVVPLYELCERLYNLFGLAEMEGQDSYLFEFFDYLTDFMENNLTDIDSFLSYWDEVLSKNTVNDCSEDGIRIMTIHKSKGLEFHSVLVPFCSWKTKKAGMIWCTGDGSTAPFNKLPLVPITVSEKMVNSIYSEEVKKEYLKIFVDNLNLIYVAFTRASKNLVVISDDKDSGVQRALNELNKKNKGVVPTFSEFITHLLPKHNGPSYEANVLTIYDVLVQSMPTTMQEEINEDECLMSFIKEGSEIIPSRTKEKKKSDNVFNADVESRKVEFHSGKSRAQFRQSNSSERFINGEDLDSTGTNYQNEGLLFHEILSGVNTEADIDTAIRRLDFEGCFTDAWQREKVKHLVKKAFVSPLSKGWFDSHWTVINEHDIVFVKEERHADGRVSRHVTRKRPDRIITDGKQTIVIDYKTGKYDKEHENQVREYMDLLIKMGMPDVTGFLWYIRDEAILQVQLKP